MKCWWKNLYYPQLNKEIQDGLKCQKISLKDVSPPKQRKSIIDISDL